MIMPRNIPLDAYMDDPAETIDRAHRAESEERLRSALASGALTCIGEWITRGRGGVTNRAFRADIVLLSISPQFLPCDYPNAAWVGRQHGVTRQRASELWREFAEYIAPCVQFKGQRFLNQRSGSQKRRGCSRGQRSRKPGPVTGA